MHPDPHNQPHQPYGQQYPYGYPPQQPMPRKVVSVSKERGLGGLTHTANLVLTIFTCGLWGLVWACWWFFRMIKPKKRRTTHYYR